MQPVRELHDEVAPATLTHHPVHGQARARAGMHGQGQHDGVRAGPWIWW